MLRPRIGLGWFGAWALATAMACKPTSIPVAAGTAPRPVVSGERTGVVTPVPWPPPGALSPSDYHKRLFEAFARCGQFDLGRLDGQWAVSDSAEFLKVREVWICDGHIRWRDELGLINDICISQIAKVPGGLNVEGAWHEDWHDLGDAKGIYIRLRESTRDLSVEASAWDDAPTELSRLFTLVRSGVASGPQVCPFE